MKKKEEFKKKIEKKVVFNKQVRLLGNNFLHKAIVFGIAVLFVLNVGSALSISVPNRMIFTANSRNVEWDVTLTFIETGGKNDYVIFGEAPDASDGVDIYDAPNPPGGIPPFLDTYITTSFPWPHNKLLQEIKEYPDTYKEWNFTVWWTGSDTTVTVSWYTSEVSDSEYDSVFLCNSVGVPLVDMLSNNNYTFFCPGSNTVSFKIICSSNQPPVAVNDTASTPEDTPVIINVTANDYDPDGTIDPTTVTTVDDPSNGNISVNPTTGEVTYTPDLNFNGGDTFTYTVKDNDGVTSNVATVTITVTGVNDDPVANDDDYNTDEDTTLNVAAPGVLQNDTDDDGPAALIAELEADVSHGTLTLNTDGSFVYTPDSDWNGDDIFTYKAYDGEDYSNIATVIITVDPVNEVPVVNDDFYNTDEDVTLNVVAPGVLGNDSDVDGPAALIAELETDVSHGTLTLNTDGSFVYTPDSDWNGDDIFTYKAYDGEDYSNIATVIITVDPVNDDPEANDDTAFVEQYSSDNQIDVLENDFDIDGDDLEIIGVTTPSHGTATYDEDFVYYTPEDDYFGSDSFTYMITDNNGSAGVTATVSVTIIENEPPEKPDKPSGETRGTVGVEYTYSSSTTDVNGDQIYYNFSWGDGSYTGWIGPLESGETVEASHTWNKRGQYEIKVMAKDEHGLKSVWSDPLPISMPKSKDTHNPVDSDAQSIKLFSLNFGDSMNFKAFINLIFSIIKGEYRGMNFVEILRTEGWIK